MIVPVFVKLGLVVEYGGSFTLWCFFVTGLILGVDFRRWVNR